MEYRKSWNLRSIPDFLLSSEWCRRANAKRAEPARKKVMRPCKHCGWLYGYRDLRAHLPVCEKNPRVMREAGTALEQTVGKYHDALANLARNP